MPFTIFDFADAIAVGGDDVFVASGDGIYVLRGDNAPPVLLTAEPLTVNIIKVDATYVVTCSDVPVTRETRQSSTDFFGAPRPNPASHTSLVLSAPASQACWSRRARTRADPPLG